METFVALPPVKAFLKMMLNYANFKDRTGRSDFWWAILASFILGFVLGLIFGLLGTFGSILSTIYSLAMFVPGLALWVRRLHDIGKSGWWYLIALTGIGAIVLIIWAAKEGDQGDNQYGPDPNSSFGY